MSVESSGIIITGATQGASPVSIPIPVGSVAYTGKALSIGGGASILWSTDYGTGADITQVGYGIPHWPHTDIQYLDFSGNWQTAGHPNGEEICAAAARGGSGRGQRHWVTDGVNGNSGSLVVKGLPSAPFAELWIRWYMKYQSGFHFANLNYHKWLYCDKDAGNSFIPEWRYPDGVNLWTAAAGNNLNSSSGGWQTVMGGTNSDGQWHCYEVHVNLGNGSNNGVCEIWIDNVRYLNETAINFGRTSFSEIIINENMSDVSNGSEYYVDIDDFAISTQGKIGA